ncbi:aminotransferase class I/II-fold pyridoxal phosphate-dependent enzyme [Herbiconiux moechotypicola]|uniref:Bifunctional o-acetylhomoserine/o-acetylserine sulfhydrylase n=1 Tax=Herbiconiux moechotypicola TaxID=637393 RepID=A0ABP5Q6J7_9MICO|nr:aminotransferase class I/II-fold pyridoxal phosphate-dependent enzyme [Herbiconiux moechotypicola]MCS5728741.1 aminotransferase class I/II-fold pyridoxal phosphate-dependent enzyme [Herbiconiux moechotypicola]
MTDQHLPPTSRRPGFATQQVHAGVPGAGADGSAVAGGPQAGGVNPRATPIHLSAGFVFDDFEQARDRFAGTDDGFTYTRIGNPTTSALEGRIAALEGGRGAILVGSGQAAVSTAVLALLAAGDHLVSATSIYEGSRGLFLDNFGRLGIETSFVADANDAAEWDAAVRPSTKAFFVESIPNPKNDIVDIALVAEVAHRHGIALIVDNTFATPYLERPLEHGADLVVHSASKFLAGHGTVLGGVVVTGDGFDWAVTDARGARFPHLTSPVAALGGSSYVERFGRDALAVYARDVVVSRFGPTPSPLNAFLIQQGIETLSLRVSRQSESALAVARWLERHPLVESVDYAGLESSPYRALAARYLPRGQGSVFAFTLRGGAEAARTFFDSVGLFTRMTHLGDVRSLIIHPASTTHAQRTPEQRAAAGIGDGLLRLSIGVEDVDDLLDDLEQAFGAVLAGEAGRAVAAAADAHRASGTEADAPGASGTDAPRASDTALFAGAA